MRTATIALLSCLVCSNSMAKPESYRLDGVHSQILFSTSHLGFTQSMGRLQGVSGSFEFDREDWGNSAVQAKIAVATLYMGDAAWERKILSNEFLDAKKFPFMEFKSRKLTKTGENNGLLEGELTLLNVTKPITLAIKLNKIGLHTFAMKRVAGFSATTKIKRSDFGVMRLLPAVGDVIDIRLEIEGLQEQRNKHQ